MRSLRTATREQPQCINKDSAQPTIINKQNEVLKIYLWGVCVFIPCSVCPTLCDPMGCSLPGSSVHGILHARILELNAISSSRGSSWPRDQTCPPCIDREILYHQLTWEVPIPKNSGTMHCIKLMLKSDKKSNIKILAKIFASTCLCVFPYKFTYYF